VQRGRDPGRVRVGAAPVHVPAENQFLPAEPRVTAGPNAYGKAIDEQIIFLATGIDGLFTDQADIGVLARQLHEPA
jgi:glycerophosphoryl diester phosphodiesterase